jgi:hypothetical protein
VKEDALAAEGREEFFFLEGIYTKGIFVYSLDAAAPLDVCFPILEGGIQLDGPTQVRSHGPLQRAIMVDVNLIQFGTAS